MVLRLSKQGWGAPWQIDPSRTRVYWYGLALRLQELEDFVGQGNEPPPKD